MRSRISRSGCFRRPSPGCSSGKISRSRNLRKPQLILRWAAWNVRPAPTLVDTWRRDSMFTERTEVQTPLSNVFHWNYDVLFPQMDRLYENAKRDQWNVSTTLNWDRPIEREVIDMSMMPMFQTELYRSLSQERKDQLMRKLLRGAFRSSCTASRA